MSEIESRYVKTGLWTNIEGGPIMGITITAKTKNGLSFVALLAIFTSLGLSHLFHILVCLHHQFRTHGGRNRHDVPFREQQVLLRTLPMTSYLVTESVRMLFSRRPLSLSEWQSLEAAFLAWVSALSLFAAGLYSAYFTDITNIEVLVNSGHCAFFNRTASRLALGRLYLSAVNAFAFLYADDCYTNQTTLPGRCKIFTYPRVHFTKEPVPCPFGGNICSSSGTAFDSGLVEVAHAFGLNLPQRHSVKYRKRDTCAILSQEGRVGSQDASTLYYYGAVGFAENYTFASTLSNHRDYTVMSVSHLMNHNNWQKYEPIPEVSRNDADTALRLIQMNAMLYVQPINDPMFSAHMPILLNNIDFGLETTTYYMSDAHAAVVGCMEQYQYCIAAPNATDICSSLSALPFSVDLEFYPYITTIQLSLLNLLIETASMFSLGSLNRVKTSSFAAGTGVIYSLPDDHWINEVYSWEANVWAAHQIAISNYAIGPKAQDSRADEYTTAPATTADRELCSKQKMRKPAGFINVSVFGLLLILSASCIFVLLDVLVLRFLVFFRLFERFLPLKLEF